MQWERNTMMKFLGEPDLPFPEELAGLGLVAAERAVNPARAITNNPLILNIPSCGDAWRGG